MKIILHHTLRSIKDSLGQLFVIIFTITVLTALFFVTLTLRDVFYNLQLSMASRLPGETDISISGEVLSEHELNDVLSQFDNIEYTEKFLELNALFKVTNGQDVDEKVVLIEATDLAAYKERHPDKLFFKEGLSSSARISHPEVWIMEKFAEENGVKPGDEIELYNALYSSYQKFTVTYIFESEGIFANTALNNILTDFSSIGNHGLVTDVFIKLTDDKVDETIEELSELFDGKDVTVERSIDYDHINEVVSGNEKLITVALFFVLALVIFILVSSYLVVFQKRTGELSVFKAAGATSLQCLLILVFEGLLYGSTGAVIGTILGRFAMQIVQVAVIPTYAGVIRFRTYYYVLALILGTGLSIVSSFFPAFFLIKKSINSNLRDLKELKNRFIAPIIIILFIILASCIAPIVFMPKYILIYCLLMIIDIALIIYFGAPYLVYGVSALFGKTKGVVRLSSYSIRRNKTASRLSAIVGAVIAFAFVAVSIVSVVIGAIEPYYSHFRGDFVVQTISGSENIDVAENIVSETYGVEKSIVLRSKEYKMIADGKEIEYNVYALEKGTVLSFVTKGITPGQSERFFSEDDSVIISYDMSNRLDKKIGDKVELFNKGNKKTFTVVGIDTTVTKDDRVCYVLYNNDFEFDTASIIIINNKNVPNMDIYKELSTKLQKISYYVMYYDDWTQSTNVGISGIELLLRLLQVLIGGVAFIGVINMTVSTLMDRKREFNIYRSAGMDGRGHAVLSFFEGLIYSLSGGSIGLLFGATVNIIMPEFARLIDRYISIDILPVKLFVVVAVIIAVYTFTYFLLSVRFNKKQKIERNIL